MAEPPPPGPQPSGPQPSGPQPPGPQLSGPQPPGPPAGRLGVLGWPVRHSRSPAMHRAAFAALGLRGWSYQRLPVPPELLLETVRALPGIGFVGANVTIPHKQAALALADGATPTARAIGAANTLSFPPGGGIAAENTDAGGFLRALPIDVRGRRAMVLGAGGSARAVVWALLDAGAADVAVWNRTPGRARALADALGARAVARPAAADLLVNCTSIGLDHAASDSGPQGEMLLDRAAIADYSCVTDLVYRDGGTELQRAARRAGALVVDGLDVLVGQGGLSFTLWTGHPAPLAEMSQAVRGIRSS